MTKSYHKKDWRVEFQRLEGAFSPHTLRAYYTDIGAFVDWCEGEGLPWLPLGYDLLARRSEITALRTYDVTWRSPKFDKIRGDSSELRELAELFQ